MTNGNEERKRRLAQSLRENLRRRKGQARESAAGEGAGDESNGKGDEEREGVAP
jgi:hypothetical protein